MVNNSRLLVLPDRVRYPNVASRVLAVCLQRLSADWQARWSPPVLVIEGFVDRRLLRRFSLNPSVHRIVSPRIENTILWLT